MHSGSTSVEQSGHQPAGVKPSVPERLLQNPESRQHAALLYERHRSFNALPLNCYSHIDISVKVGGVSLEVVGGAL